MFRRCLGASRREPWEGSRTLPRRFRWVEPSFVHALALATLAAAGCGKGQDAAAAPAGKGAGGGADRPIPVLVSEAVTRDVPIFLEGLGSVTAYKTVNVRSQVDGRLDKVVFREGQAVKQNEVIAQIDPRPFEILLEQGKAALARDQAQLDGAKRDLDRYEAVGGQHLLPQQQIDDQRALVAQLTGTVLNDHATIDNAKLQLDYARIKSPINGITGVRLVDPGNIVHAADTGGIVVVTQMDPIAVLFTLPQDDLPDVAKQQAQGALPVEARSRDGAQLLGTGQLELIDNQINQGTATMRLKAIFPNPDRALWPNQFVKARLRLTVRKGALVIPAVAVQRGPQGSFVYVASGDKAELRNVNVERIEGEDALISQGVSAGEKVVREGQSQLRPGAKLALRETGGAPTEGKGTGDRPSDAGGPAKTGAAPAAGGHGKHGGHKEAQ
ncbi:MAG TPA: efflux RND transporter periplasmic adaptor subunit [Polyangia bacterium]|nr:efflux RND transporter periplasmic adaptor subunit [Polyangia bacterium]